MTIGHLTIRSHSLAPLVKNCSFKKFWGFKWMAFNENILNLDSQKLLWIKQVDRSDTWPYVVNINIIYIYYLNKY